MTDQPQSRPQIAPDELHAASGASFGIIIGRLNVENLELGKLLAAARAHIDQITAGRAELDRQISQLTAGAMEYENRIHELEQRPTFKQVVDLEARLTQLIDAGPTVAQSAAHELAQTEEREAEVARKEKAAPVEAA